MFFVTLLQLLAPLFLSIYDANIIICLYAMCSARRLYNMHIYAMYDNVATCKFFTFFSAQ